MVRALPTRIVLAVSLAVAVAHVGLSATPVFASLRAGCVGSDDAGVPGTVGWTDADVLFQLGPASPPHELIVRSPLGTETHYIDGIGLRPPTDVSPFWLARVALDGEYTLIVDGYDCAVTASGSSTADVAARKLIAMGVSGVSRAVIGRSGFLLLR